MKVLNVKTLAGVLILTASIQMTACKSKTKDNSNTTTTTMSADTATNTANTAPVTVSNDDDLKRGVKDATKDYPGVNAEVNNGEITLSGQIKRDNLPKLMMTLSSLRPKKINNNLTVKQ